MLGLFWGEPVSGTQSRAGFGGQAKLFDKNAFSGQISSESQKIVSRNFGSSNVMLVGKPGESDPAHVLSINKTADTAPTGDVDSGIGDNLYG